LAVGAILAQSLVVTEEIDTEENYEHSVVKKANIITEPAARRSELQIEGNEKDERDS